MKKLIVFSCFMFIFTSCRSGVQNETGGKEDNIVQVKPVVTGAERVSEYIDLLVGKRVAFVVNQTSVIQDVHLVDSMSSLGVNITKVFAPEHGFRGDHSDGATIESGVDAKTGLKIVSLYGKNKKPSAAMLEDVDVLVFDIQDVGVRFYTFISTMHYVMEAAAENNKQVIVLDRPNPNGFYIDGPVLQKEYSSFIGMHPIPLVHGLTVGELAGMIQGENWLKDQVICDLKVIPCENYDHETLYQLPIAPSPNLPNMNSVYLYPFLGLFEGTNVSVGRGTDQPFQQIGRPGFKGVIFFTPRSIPGVSDHPKYEGRTCGGIEVPDAKDSSIFKERRLNLDYLLLFYQTNESSFQGEYFRDFFYKLSGNKEFKQQIIDGKTEAEIRASWEPSLEQYKSMRKKYLLYP